MLTRSRLGCWVLALGVACVAGMISPAFAVAAPAVPGNRLPTQVQVNLPGRIQVVYVNDFVRGGNRLAFALELPDRRRYWLDFSGAAQAPPSAAVDARVEGVLVGGSLKVAHWSTVRSPMAASGAGSPAVGKGTDTGTTRKLAVVLIGFQDSGEQPPTPGEARRMMAQVNAYYQEVSFGQLRFVGTAGPEVDVFGPLSLAARPDPRSCDYNGWAAAADSLAFGRSGPGAYQNVMYVMPGAATIGCTVIGIGWADPGGRRSWVRSFTLRTTAHELGHNLGLAHAARAVCRDATDRIIPISAACIGQEYGDPYDIMGSAPNTHHFNGYHKTRLGWLRPENVVDVTQDGEYTIAPIERRATGPQILRVPVPGPVVNRAVKHYYVEYRHDAVITPGALIHAAPDPGSPFGESQGFVIDNGADTDRSEDVALTVGRTFTDPISGITISAIRQTAAGLTVRVARTTPTASACVRKPPGVSLQAEARRDSAGKIRLDIRSALQNRDGGGCEDSLFQLEYYLPAGWLRSAHSVKLTPGESTNGNAVVELPAGVMPGTYPLYLVVSNAAAPGQRQVAQATVALFLI